MIRADLYFSVSPHFPLPRKRVKVSSQTWIGFWTNVRKARSLMACYGHEWPIEWVELPDISHRVYEMADALTRGVSNP